ncbi:hypothetical protein [Streptomyces griseoluteus]|uniref:hypothetical protein n=1 Tax=Streptomyces griseoluteus TaxID=29306 RepID=UPI0036A4767B
MMPRRERVGRSARPAPDGRPGRPSPWCPGAVPGAPGPATDPGRVVIDLSATHVWDDSVAALNAVKARYL